MKLDENHFPAQRSTRECKKRLKTVATSKQYASKLSIARVRSGICDSCWEIYLRDCIVDCARASLHGEEEISIVAFGQDWKCSSCRYKRGGLIPYIDAVSFGRREPRLALINLYFMSKGCKMISRPWITIRTCFLIRVGGVMWGLLPRGYVMSACLQGDVSSMARRLNKTVRAFHTLNYHDIGSDYLVQCLTHTKPRCAAANSGV